MYSLLELLQILSLCLAKVNGEKKFSVILLNLTQKWLLSGHLCAGQVWTLSSVPSEKVLLITESKTMFLVAFLETCLWCSTVTKNNSTIVNPHRSFIFAELFLWNNWYPNRAAVRTQVHGGCCWGGIQQVTLLILPQNILKTAMTETTEEYRPFAAQLSNVYLTILALFCFKLFIRITLNLLTHFYIIKGNRKEAARISAEFYENGQGQGHGK